MLQVIVAHPGDEVYVDAFGEFKWGGKYYEGEILGVSGECYHALRVSVTRR